MADVVLLCPSRFKAHPHLKAQLKQLTLKVRNVQVKMRNAPSGLPFGMKLRATGSMRRSPHTLCEDMYAHPGVA